MKRNDSRNEYVITDCKVFDAPELVVLIEKQRPKWQMGRLNLPGGKVEANESPTAAAFRELLEETGLEAGSLRKAGEIRTAFEVIHVFQATVGDYVSPTDMGTGERRIDLDVADFFSDPRVLPNLRVIVPMVRFNTPKFAVSPLDHHSLSNRWGIQFYE